IIVDRKPYSLDEQLKQVAILLSPQWNEKNIQVEIELPDLLYFGNPDLMQHVWINLLNNAIKYTPKGGTIVISGKQEKSWISVSFRDSGIGMTSNEIANIFNKYYQSTPNDNGRGLGLGLAIVSRIVSLAKGQIAVESEKDGGSAFTVFLPDEMGK
ncbi:MAG: HAMP domain-containing sensor histidine kinase, partial [Trichococcus sp.]|uniref:sensor histidine kinase n=1 Tax=Trichococcus sp. TaxID=1985464 RepID=UPI003C3C2F8C